MPNHTNPRLFADHHLLTVPAHRLITLRDQENDAATDAGPAIRQAHEHVAANTGYEVYLSCAQDLIPVAINVEIWNDQPPGLHVSGQEQQVTVSPQTLECPSGQLVLGSPTGEAIGIDLPEPGIYSLRISHHGRAEATEHRNRIVADYAADTITDLRTAADAHAATEHYTIQIWHTAPITEED